MAQWVLGNALRVWKTKRTCCLQLHCVPYSECAVISNTLQSVIEIDHCVQFAMTSALTVYSMSSRHRSREKYLGGHNPCSP